MAAHTYTRRAILADLFRITACSAISMPAMKAIAQSEFGGPHQQRRGLGQYTQGFQQHYRVPAMSVAISKGGPFVYDRAGGTADRQHMMQAQQNTLFRIADLSKPITAVTIFSLIQAGRFNLNDKVFGPAGILGIKYGKIPFKPYV